MRSLSVPAKSRPENAILPLLRRLFALSPTDLCIIHLSLPASRTPFSGQVVKKSTGTWLHKEWRNINGLPLGNCERWNKLLFFILRSQDTAKEPEESRRGAGADEQKGSFSEVRRKLSRKTGKKGGEIWPPSQISSAHGGEVLQEFSVICAIRPFFLPSGFSSCCRGNKKSALFPASPSPQAFGRSIIILTFCIESCYIFVNTYKYFVGEHFILPFKGPGRYTRGVRTEA